MPIIDGNIGYEILSRNVVLVNLLLEELRQSGIVAQPKTLGE
jgi:hypothetical protein